MWSVFRRSLRENERIETFRRLQEALECKHALETGLLFVNPATTTFFVRQEEDDE